MQEICIFTRFYGVVDNIQTNGDEFDLKSQQQQKQFNKAEILE